MTWTPLADFDTLAERDGCPDPRETTEGDVTTVVCGPCRAGSAAAFATIASAGRPWPGGTARVSPSGVETYSSYDATAELVGFLLSHLRP